LLQESIGADYVDVDIRLRKGNYQYDLARSIASFQLELHYPDVKDLVERLYGEEKVDDQQFVRKIQTILKKMERNGVVRILPKRKPWELQRYALSSFKFIDVDKKSVVLAAPKEIERARNLLGTTSVSMQSSPAPNRHNRINALMLTSIIVAAFTVVFWSLLQPILQPIAFVPAFCVAVVCSVALGEQWASGEMG
jgi:hypothetical protein